LSATATHHAEPREAGWSGRAKLVGLLAEFETPDAILTAARKVRDAGFTRWDTHTPFPVHGIDQAMGIKMTRLPYLVFAFGAIGCSAGILLQWWANATSFGDFGWIEKTLGTFVEGYRFLISGKPAWSFPANVPVIFELTILFSALSCAIGMLVLNNLPLWHNPIFNTSRFKRATTDRFFVRIDADDPKFSQSETQRFLAGLGATAVDRIEDYPSREKPPAILPRAAVVLGCAALIPLTIIWLARNNTTDKPRYHIVQDMDNQEKFKSQRASTVFADGRAMRPPVAGAVARDPRGQDMGSDAHFSRGYRLVPDGEGQKADFFDSFPAQLLVDEKFVRRGQTKFNIYCAPCHGLDGRGAGMVANRAM